MPRRAAVAAAALAAVLSLAGCGADTVVPGLGGDDSDTGDGKKAKAAVERFARAAGPEACDMLTPAALRNVYGAKEPPGPPPELFVILGTDAAAALPTWERVEEVRARATIVVVERPGSREVDPLPGWSWVRVEVPRLEVSSTDLRARVVDGRPLDYLLTRSVIDCIEARGLYRERVAP
jgi:nicotinic acid mononucleotide adenylyltransferase